MKKLALAVTVIIFSTVGCMGCANPATPAGEEGYITRGAWVGQEKFVGIQTGPTSTGLGWLLRVQNVNVQWQTLSEEFSVMSADNLNLKFNAHITMRPKPQSVKEIIEIYGGDDWYKRNLSEPFRNAVYEAVAGYNALDAKDKREEIADKVKIKFLAYLAGKPFEVSAIVVGTINLPKSVADAQETKIAKQTEIETMNFDLQVEMKKAEKRRIEAQGVSDAQKIIQATLTPLYIQHEAIEAQKLMVGSPNHTTVYIPSGNNGVPLVKTIE